MDRNIIPSAKLARSITHATSKQAFTTIRFLVDGNLRKDAFRAYAYFRWVDDCLDGDSLNTSQRFTFLNRQKSLMESCYRGETPQEAAPEERMLIDMIENDRQGFSGLQSYIRNMMAVMEFDTQRRERLISQHELIEYARLLATAVTDALHHFIGSRCAAPNCEERYLAATGAHITHMLRDLVDDIDSGYINIPRELLRTHHFDLQDLENDTLRDWVMARARLARACFEKGKAYLAQVESLRCRIAGWAYIARFEIILDVIERDGFNLRADYNTSKDLASRLRMLWAVTSQLFNPPHDETIRPTLPA